MRELNEVFSPEAKKQPRWRMPHSANDSESEKELERTLVSDGVKEQLGLPHSCWQAEPSLDTLLTKLRELKDGCC